MRQSFEDFLKDTFMSDEPESATSKETFDDNFDRWMQQADLDLRMAYAEKWHAAQMLEITNDINN